MQCVPYIADGAHGAVLKTVDDTRDAVSADVDRAVCVATKTAEDSWRGYASPRIDEAKCAFGYPWCPGGVYGTVRTTQCWALHTVWPPFNC